MATEKQREAARKNVRKAATAAREQKSLANDEAKRRGLPGRSKMGRDELARALERS
jgi:hypothetical protein